MNNFDIIRKKASSLYNELMFGLSEPLTGFELVKRAADKFGYKIIPRKPDDTLLNGSEAVLDRGILSILYSELFTEEEVAALIAHELGHYVLHEGEMFCDSGIDISSPEEASPVGIQRVEGYNEKERQEIQANVFARELLFPRNVVKKLFIDEQLCASSLAKKLKIPINIVFQQLCDSLLVPVAPEDEKTNKPLQNKKNELDDSQKKAVVHRNAPLLLEAGPGTGKTRTLVARIVSLINEGATPESILALTFSNKAANELTERIADELPDEAPKIWTGTFHAFGLELLRKYHHLAGLESDVKMFDRTDAVEVLEEILPTMDLVHHQNLYEPALELKEMLSAISRAKDEVVDADSYMSFAQAMKENANDDELTKSEKAIEVAKVYKLYEHKLNEKKAVDFGDLIMKPTLLIEQYPIIKEDLQKKFKHIFVDEYQDINRASARFIKSLAGKGENLWAVGDLRQSIYRFRGASSANMALFSTDYKSVVKMALTINYRSAKEIIDTFSTFAKSMKVSEFSSDMELKSYRGLSGKKPTVYVLPDFENEVSAVAGNIKMLEKEGVSFRDQAVLCRTNARLDDFAKGLEARNIPVLHLGSLFERDEIKDMLSLLLFLSDKTGASLIRLATFPDYNIPLQDVFVFLKTVEESNKVALEVLFDHETFDGISRDGLKGLGLLSKDLAGFKKISTPWRVLSEYLFNRSNYLMPLIKSHQIKDVMKKIALYQFLNFVRAQNSMGSGTHIIRLLNKIRRLCLLGEERDLRKIPSAALHIDAIRLMTVHGSKGLEFEAVHMPSIMTSSFPTRFSPPRCPPPDGIITKTMDTNGTEAAKHDHKDEEECLFFVSLSRAKKHLILYRSKKSRGGQNSNPSIFLSLMNLTVSEGSNPPLILAESSGYGTTSLNISKQSEISGRDIIEFERCPRRYLYSHVFGLAGFKRDGAFVKTHKCIYELLDWLKERGFETPIDRKETFEKFEQSWAILGPVEHGLEAAYKNYALKIINNLLDMQSGLLPMPKTGEVLSINLANGSVIVEADSISSAPDGTALLRLIKTGKKGSFKGDDTIHGVLHETARRHYGDGQFKIEVLHLTDKGISEIEMSSRKIGSRLEKANGFLADMSTGRFPMKKDSIICPRCPHFFICPTVPEGTLPKKTK